MKSHLWDVLAIAGGGLIAVGIALWSVPAALVVLGLGLFAVALVGAYSCS